METQENILKEPRKIQQRKLSEIFRSTIYDI